MTKPSGSSSALTRSVLTRSGSARLSRTEAEASGGGELAGRAALTVAAAALAGRGLPGVVLAATVLATAALAGPGLILSTVDLPPSPDCCPGAPVSAASGPGGNPAADSAAPMATN